MRSLHACAAHSQVPAFTAWAATLPSPSAAVTVGATCAAPRCVTGRRAEIAAAVCQLSNMFLVCIACEWLRQGCQFACCKQAAERWPWLQRGQWQQACLARPACWAHALRCIV